MSSSKVGHCTFLFSIILYLIFTINFLEVTNKKRIFATRT